MAIGSFSVYDKYGRTKLPLLKSRLFWFGLAIKLLLAVFFASDYLKEQFAPFGNYFIGSHCSNPYAYFSLHGQGTEFPYPPLMLWLFSLPRMLFWFLIPGGSAFSLADALLYRLPLLLADFSILVVLMRWLKPYSRPLLIWYWLSPVLLYINYFHGQLDVIPMALLMLSLHFLFRERWGLSALLLAMAVGCKTNMALVLPFYSIYLIRTPKVRIATLLQSAGIFLAVLLLINFPYWQDAGFRRMVYDNPVQRQVFNMYFSYGNLRFYIIPAVYFILVIWYASFRFVNRDQLVLFLSFTFLALTLLIPPMQGWYFWILPLLVFFIVKQSLREQGVFILLSGLYFLYFALIPGSDFLNALWWAPQTGTSLQHWLGFSSEAPLNLAFTLLQTTLLLSGYLVYREGIKTNIQTKFLSQPYMIGVGGDSASGKSTLSTALAAVFEPAHTTIIRGDDMHRWERGDANWERLTHLDPRANKLHEEMDQARQLKTGKGIRRRSYDHSTGRFTLPRFLKPNRLIVFEGLHSFYLKNHADVYDLKIFMEPDEQLRMWWKVRRDVQKRGYTPEKVLEQIRHREEDSIKFIRTQAAQADLLASFFPRSPIDPLDQDTIPEVLLRISLPNDHNMEPLLDRLSGLKGLTMEHRYEPDRQVVVFDGNASADDLANIASRMIPELEEVGIYNPQWKSNYTGLLQLMVCYLIFVRLKQG